MLLSGLMFSALWADDGVAYIYPDGSGLELVNDERVTMLAETVDVRVVEDIKVKVDAVFWVKNLTDKKVKIKVAFPFKGFWGDEGEYEYYSDEEIDKDETMPDLPFAGDSMHFVSLVDGKAVKTKMIRNKNAQDDYDFYYVWDLSFEPGQKRRLQTRYNTVWNWWSNNMAEFGYSFSYVLLSGATWAGPIKSALIRVQIPQKVRPFFDDTAIQSWTKVVPKHYRVKPDYSEIVWRFEDWEPDQDLNITSEGFNFMFRLPMILWDVVGGIADLGPDHRWTEQEVWEYSSQFGGLPEDNLQYLINTMFALSGHRFSQEKWQGLFENFDWYHPKKSLSVQELPDNYRKCVEIATRLRKQIKQARKRAEAGPYGKFIPSMAVLFWDRFGSSENLFISGEFVSYLPPSRQDQKLWLRLARNAFYAQAGRRFKDQQLQDFFTIMPWYIPKEKFEGLDEDQQQAVDVITEYEKKHGF